MIVSNLNIGGISANLGTLLNHCVHMKSYNFDGKFAPSPWSKKKTSNQPPQFAPLLGLGLIGEIFFLIRVRISLQMMQGSRCVFDIAQPGSSVINGL